MLSSFFDTGSMCSLILTTVAEKYGLSGHPVNLTIETVNGERSFSSKQYGVELLTSTGERRLLRAFGIEKISEVLPFVEIDETRHQFSEKVHEIWEKLKERP